MKSGSYNTRAALYLFCVFITLFFMGCAQIRDQVTTLEIVDNNRHYYPILRGQELEVVFDIKNTGEHPFILSEMLISCGCVVSKKSSINSIPAGAERRIILTYDSSKNIGLVKHHIDIYGNLANKEKKVLEFDVNVVPESAYTRDYEELFREKQIKDGSLKRMTEGDENNKGYYLD